jgi:hypothetical protein
MLCLIFKSKFNFPALASPDCWRREDARAVAVLAAMASETEMTGWPTQQANSAMTMRAGQPRWPPSNAGLGVAALCVSVP